MTEPITTPERLTVVSNLSSSYAAIYIDGRLKEFGDYDEILEKALDWVGVAVDYDDGVTRSGARGDMAPTLDAIAEWNAGESERLRAALVAEHAARQAELAAAAQRHIVIHSAAEKRAAAQALLAEADALDATSV